MLGNSSEDNTIELSFLELSFVRDTLVVCIKLVLFERIGKCNKGGFLLIKRAEAYRDLYCSYILQSSVLSSIF